MKNLLKTESSVQLDLRTTEKAIELVKSCFEKTLCSLLDLQKVSAPMVVLHGTGINDDLNGIERAVGFPIKDMQEQRAEVVHSLAKWKRMRLMQLGIKEGQGLLTDMRALRPDEELSAIHSITVDQFDWEKHITKSDRCIDYLKSTVQSIYAALKKTEAELFEVYPVFEPFLPAQIQFIHAEDLLQKFPDKTAKEREHAIAKAWGAVFIIGIGGTLSDGKKHDGRAPDYDDWSTPTQDAYKGLNGDIIVWNPVLKTSFELSSMGIRVDKQALERQLEIEKCTDRKSLQFHQLLLQEELPLSIGGGIGQSRLAMLLLQKSHIGEVQVSIWPEKMRHDLLDKGIRLL